MIFFKQTLKNKLLLISIIPIIIICCSFLFIASDSIKKSTKNEIFITLNGVCQNLRDDFSKLYPDFIEIFGSDSNIDKEKEMEANQLLEKYKKYFNTEVTIFYGNKRILTTIKNENGERIIHTIQEDKNIINTVFSGKNYTSGGVIINNEEYYVSYIPIYNKNNIVCGMVFAGLSNTSFITSIKHFKINMIVVYSLIIVVLIIFISFFARNIGNVFTSIKNYLNLLVEKQNITITMDKKVLTRKDEFGDLARYAQEAGNQLNKMICLDPLTKTYNRRAGTQFIDYFFEEAVLQKIDLTLVMCDIDHFKKINDSYGHKSGDEVLIKTSNILKSKESIFTIRWGGEEFLLGFALPCEDVVPIIQELSKQISEIEYIYNQTKFNITLSFGIASYESQPDASTLVCQADKNLYIGKKSGRNTIIY